MVLCVCLRASIPICIQECVNVCDVLSASVFVHVNICTYACMCIQFVTGLLDRVSCCT